MDARGPNDIDLIVGANLKKLRMERGLKLTDVARGVGQTWQMIQKYENAGNRIPSGRLANIAMFFQVGISVFFAGTLCDDRPKVEPEIMQAALALDSMTDEKMKKAIVDLIMTASMDMWQPARQDTKQLRT